MTQFAWHVHHDVIVEPLILSIESRIADIKEWGPEEEVEARLRLFKPVKGKLPEEVIRAWERYGTWKAYEKALRKYRAEIETLHRQECPNCPWDGKTIFPTKWSRFRCRFMNIFARIVS